MIYLDNAATTFPKPPEVIEAVTECMSKSCGNPGRGSHVLAAASSRILYDCREAAADLFGLDDPEGVVFTLNATHALNAAIFGLLREGDHVLISDLEHNSVLRPVEYLKKTGRISYDIFSTKQNPVRSIQRLLRKNTAAVIALHSSNIINKTLPAADIGRLCRQLGILYIVDASQSAGNTDINMKRDNISVLCTAGHKGLLGPQGTGLALFGEGIIPDAFMHGGSGVNSKDPYMPGFLPDRLEAGTMATPAAAGLLEGIRFIQRRGASAIGAHERQLTDILHRRFARDTRLRIYSSTGGGLMLFNINGISPQRVADLLDKKDICVRAGLHCAPLAHRTVGTPEGGAVRAGVGPFNTESDINAFCLAIDEIADSVNKGKS